MIVDPQHAPLPEVPRLALSPRELAESLGISERTFANWIAAGDAPPSFIAHGGRLRLFPIDTAREWLRARVQTETQDERMETTANGIET